jgi:predicted negative regulator of RcsB-dependent stress response
VSDTLRRPPFEAVILVRLVVSRIERAIRIESAQRAAQSKDRVLAKKKTNRTAETLAGIEASGDRVAEWASKNAAIILGVIAGVLVLAAGVGFWIQHRSDTRDAAVNALARTSSEYRVAMGADPTAGVVPEPANAELAERTRTEFAARFEEVGREYEGTTVGAIGMLEAGALRVELGELEEATGDFEAAREGAGRSAIAALASIRLAGLAEERGDMPAAAAAYEAAAAVVNYPLRADALADAARCWASANEGDRAIATYQRLESEFPDELVSPPIKSLIEELRLSRRS